eukprot:GILI01056897.1.p1 GENE.GILI01056897.1~~GILI01056897.1.p1  ORF type:complete len:268 (+),score=1.53 GILI01056897.1:80-805(+)
MFSDKLDWQSIEEESKKLAFTAQDSTDQQMLYTFYTKKLRAAGDKHSFFISEKQMKQIAQAPVLEMPQGDYLGDHIAWVKVPRCFSFDKQKDAHFADTIRRIIEKLDTEHQVEGRIVDLGELNGKVVFLNFWATWCPPCLAEMPSVNKLYEQYKTDAEVVFLLEDADNDFTKAQAYMDRKSYQLPVYNAITAVPETIFKGSLPTTIVFDKMGRISFKGEGAANYNSPKFIAFIQQLKAQKN